MTIKELIKVLRKLEKDNGNLPVVMWKYNTRGGAIMEVNEVKIGEDQYSPYLEINAN